MQYKFILKDNNEKAYRLFNWFLLFLHIVAAWIIVLKTPDPDVKLDIYILLGFYVLITLGYYFSRGRKKSFETYSLIMALFYGNFWLKHIGLVAVLIFAAVFLFVSFVRQKKTYLLFTEKEVQLTRVFKNTSYTWNELENVILKDGLLTVDFKTNNLIQSEIIEPANTLDETEFNRFCNSRLNNKA